MRIHFVLLATFLVLGGACDSKDSEKKVEPKEIVGSLDVPLSLRNNSKPTGALLQVSPAEVVYEGKSVLTLEKGKFRRDDLSKSRSIPKLKTVLKAGPTTLKVHSMVQHGALLSILRSLHEKGVRTVYFVTNIPGNIGTHGAMQLDNFGFVDRRQDPPEEAETFEWDTVAKNWEAMSTACSGGDVVDCDPKASKVVPGGKATLTVSAFDDAARLAFRRVDEEKVEATLEEKAERDLVAEDLPPAKRALFTWNISEARKPDSAISKTLRPFCSGESCTVVFVANRYDPASNAIAMLGAAFPNGFPAPRVFFQER